VPHDAADTVITDVSCHRTTTTDLLSCTAQMTKR
jgi:hypothetical protein